MTASLEELKKQVQGGHLDRPALIKLLRKARMAAINAGNSTELAAFDAPVEVMADRIIAEKKG